MARIERSALGRVAKIGDFYDVRTESFLGDNIFKENLDEDDVDVLDLGETSVDLLLSDKLEDKFSKLGIDAELSASILCDLFKLSGSGGFLNEKKTSTTAQVMSLIYEIKTASEEVSLRNKDVKKKVDMEALKSVLSTHVLIGIDWGARCTVTAEYQNHDYEDHNVVNTKLKAKLKYLEGLLTCSPGASGQTAFDKSKGVDEKNWTFKSKCDVGNRDSDIPITFKEAVEQAKSLPNSVKNTNNGKGVPLTFYFTPIQSLLKTFKFEMNANNTFQSIREDTMKHLVQRFGEIQDIKYKIRDAQTDLKMNADCIQNTSLNDINSLQEIVEAEEIKFKGVCQTLLQEIRSNKKDVSSLNTTIEKSYEGELSSAKVEKSLQCLQSELNKTFEVDRIRKQGIEYLGKAGTPNITDKETVFVFYTDNILLNSPELSFFWSLYRTYKDKEDTKFCVVDLKLRQDFHKNNTIYKYIKGKEVSKNVMEDFGRNSHMNLIKRIQTKKAWTGMPNDRAIIKIRCPLALLQEGKCSGSPQTWLCEKCNQNMWYGIKSRNLYCPSCKEEFSPEGALFRCKEDSHGLDFFEFPSYLLKDELSGLRSSKETNIILLGETGTGKSTWINGFYNYLYFEDLEEAAKISKEHSPVVLIPSSFTFSKDGIEKKIMIGDPNDNEVLATGQSATQEPKTYQAIYGDQIVNLIDTPGIGDVRGIEQDKENFDKILSHLSYYPEIHAICILLQPNQARLTVSFRFVIQELMTHLHRDAAKNICFCFTNARGSFYEPGDTLQPLRKFLEEKNTGIEATIHNMFCFDNEAFRFLACIQNGVEFESDVKALYAESWNKSKKEARRLMVHVDELKPHKVMNTTSLNDTRRVIVELTRPLAEITVLIQKNIQIMEDSKVHSQYAADQAEGLQKNLQYEGIDLEHEELDFPRTVCAHPSCTKYIPIGKDKIQQLTFPQICHEKCTLTSIRAEVVGDPWLIFCNAMLTFPLPLKGCCKQPLCGHSYKCHQHISYELIQVKKNFISEEVFHTLKNMRNKEERAKAEMAEYEKVVTELREEQTMFLKISATFAMFLKSNAIVPYNDALGDYLDLCVKLEEEKPGQHRNTTKIESLKKSKLEYVKEKEILEGAIRSANSSSLISPTEIKDLIDKLFSMKHFGQSIRDIREKVVKKNQNNRFLQENIPPPPQKKNDKKANLTNTVVNAMANWSTPSDPVLQLSLLDNPYIL